MIIFLALYLKRRIIIMLKKLPTNPIWQLEKSTPTFIFLGNLRLLYYFATVKDMNELLEKSKGNFDFILPLYSWYLTEYRNRLLT